MPALILQLMHPIPLRTNIFNRLDVLILGQFASFDVGHEACWCIVAPLVFCS